MKTHQIFSVLLVSLFMGAGLVSAQSVSDDFVNGVKLRGDGTVDDTQPGAPAGDVIGGVKRRGDGSIDDDLRGVSDDIGPNDTLEAKLAKLERQRVKREAQRERALAGLALDDPKRIEINARFDRQLAKLDAKQARLEARGGDDDGVGDAVRREDRRADRRADRQADRQADRREDRQADRVERPERAQRPEKVERVERPQKIDRPERVERSGRGGGA